MIQEQPKPPPPPPPPKPEVKPVPVVKPVPTPVPQVDKVEQARRKAEKAGIEQFKDQLADLREKTPIDEGQTKNLTGVVGADSHAERSLITSKVGTASSGITSTSSRGFGSGAGSLTGHETATVTSAIAHSGLDDRGATRTGSSGKAARSREEIELVFDRNKGAIYTLYARALREHPELQGKLVLEFTIAPSGEVTMCKVVSSELHNEELESKIVARVKSFRFEPKDVETITTTKPIDFFPA
jgi:TonB family protein